MAGERRIPAPRDLVWQALNDLVVLKAAIPGCESLEKLSDTAMKATVAVRIGPISARFTGKMSIADSDPPNFYRLSGEGQGGVAGFAKGSAEVRLTADGAATLLAYDVRMQVGGKMAQLGARLIDASARQMADAFFIRFAELVAPPLAEQPVAAAPAVPAKPHGLAGLVGRQPPGIRVALGIAAALGLALLIRALLSRSGF